MDDELVQSATLGTFVKMETNIDPSLGRSSRLAGMVSGLRDTPPVFCGIVIEYIAFDEDFRNSNEENIEERDRKRVAINDTIVLCIETMRTAARVTDVNGSSRTLALATPICAIINEVTLSKRVGPRWVPVGKGIITCGIEACQL